MHKNYMGFYCHFVVLAKDFNEHKASYTLEITKEMFNVCFF